MISDHGYLVLFFFVSTQYIVVGKCGGGGCSLHGVHVVKERVRTGQVLISNLRAYSQ
jgi:hypothetical protein